MNFGLIVYLLIVFVIWALVIVQAGLMAKARGHDANRGVFIALVAGIVGIIVGALSDMFGSMQFDILVGVLLSALVLVYYWALPVAVKKKKK